MRIPIASHNEKLGILKPQFGASSKQQVDLEIEIVGYLTYLIFQNSRQMHCPEPFRIDSLNFPLYTTPHANLHHSPLALVRSEVI